MASITVNTNGQVLRVNASISHWTSAALAVVASGDDDIPSTATTTITSNYTMHFANTATTVTITVKQVDGTTLLAQTFEVNPGIGPRTLNPIPDPYQVAADTGSIAYTSYLGLVTVGQETMPRPLVASTVTQTSQRLNVGFWVARKTELATRVRVDTGGTAAGATPTLCRIGLYTAAADDALTLVASTTNDTALFGTQNTTYTKDLTTPYQITAGVRYATGILVVSGAAAPTLAGAVVGTALSTITAPKSCGFATSQADLPETVANNGLTATTTAPWAVFMPAA